ncbi:MAG: DEAD/DEAH box helicase [Proteobacteria bacterium]|nr:DEAD/DEAH box helicase [Pseudomonadota bacterium]
MNKAMEQVPKAHRMRQSGPIKRLIKLAPIERGLIELASVFYEPTTRTDLARTLKRAGHRIGSRAPTGAGILPTLQALTRQGWLVGDTHWEVSPRFVHAITRHVAREGRLDSMTRDVRTIRPIRDESRMSRGELLRELRIALYSRCWDEARQLAEAAHGAFASICQPLDREWLVELPDDLRTRALMDVLDASLAALVPAPDAMTLLEQEPDLTDAAHQLLVEQLVLRGRLGDAEDRLASRSSLQARVGRAWVLALGGRWKEANEAYENALHAFLKQAGKRRRFFPDLSGIFFIVSLLADGREDSLERARGLSTAAARNGVSRYTGAYQILSESAALLCHAQEADDLLYTGSALDLDTIAPMELLLRGLGASWVERSAPRPLIKALQSLSTRAKAAGYDWLAAQAACTVRSLRPTKKGGHGAPCCKHLPGVCLPRAVNKPERWPRALDALLEVAAGGPVRSPASQQPDGDRRLVWIVTEHYQELDLEPREQTRSKKGVWSKGRPVALKRLAHESGEMDFLSAADRAVCSSIEESVSYSYYGRYRDVTYAIDPGPAFSTLVGQPNVLTEVSGQWVPVEIRKRPAKLRVERRPKKGGFRIVLDPMPRNAEEQVCCERVGPSTIEVVAIEPKHHAIAKALGKKGLELPASAEARLREVPAALSKSIAVDTDLELDASDAETVAGDPSPRFLLRPLGDGMSVEVIVRPLGERGPAANPGCGGGHMVAEIDDRRVLASRNLVEERRQLDEVLAACPTLSSADNVGRSYQLPNRVQALEALVELRSRLDPATLEWPDGEVLEVTEPASIEHLDFSFREAGGLFEAKATLDLPGTDPLALSTLVGYLDASPGRFLRVAGDRRFLALTADLRHRLDELQALADSSANKRLRFHRLVVPQLEDLLDGARVVSDDAWKQQLNRLTTGATEEVPSTFRGELRPYQLDGFRWLARLGHWGAGGCLADEMGLGKTVQVAALLSLRAQQGPSLVVAPTSVLVNWADEIARFAPTLRVRLFAGGDRTQALSELKPFDLVLTSYSLLQQEIEALEQARFVVAVLDEAQAIKNPRTRRAQAACRLVAQQRIVATGTPIENRTGELWSLFHFLNPGLLGSHKSFELQFARPIERNRDRAAQGRLQRLISPFILRRTKTSVLEELPSRTDVTLRVALEPDEMALYESVREKALAKLSSLDAGVDARRMHLLAQITRLRRAASNTRLVLPDHDAPSAKLAALAELLDKLREDGHKVLIFSQFVDHLSLIRELLDAKNVSYQYLDGKTALSKRHAAIQKFQAGEGDAFLISLKAGGFGLNLTAADYVVHMDPWWNPAVEDQASDRAHRIGQTRPVTIYRIVARETIEDRIVDLHHRKRDLAASLLEGSDVSARISEEEMLALIRGSSEPFVHDRELSPALTSSYQAGRPRVG